MRPISPLQVVNELRQKIPSWNLIGSSAGMIECALAHLLHNEKNRKILIVTKDYKEQAHWVDFFSQIFQGFSLNDKNSVSVLPFFSGWGSDRFVNPLMIRTQRMQALMNLKRTAGFQAVVTTIRGLSQICVSPEYLEQCVLGLKTGQELDIDSFVEQLTNMGYRERRQVDEESTFSIRGGVIDIFSPSNDNPVRIELFGDDIASMRLFSISDQRSLREITDFQISPSQEIVFSQSEKPEIVQRVYDHFLATGVRREDRDGWMDAFRVGLSFPGVDMLSPIINKSRSPIFDFLSADDGVVFTQSVESTLEKYCEHYDAWQDQHKKDLAEKRISVKPSMHFCDPEILLERLLSVGVVDAGLNTSHPLQSETWRVQSHALISEIQNVSQIKDGAFRRWSEFIQRKLEERWTIFVCAGEKANFERLKSLFEHRDIDIFWCEDSDVVFEGSEAGRLLAIPLHLTDPVVYEEKAHVFLPFESLLGYRAQKESRRSPKLQNYINSFKDLKVGDRVVHIQHGVGRYLGMKSLTVAEAESEFLVLEYKGGDKVYLPVDKLNLLQKYSSSDENENVQIDSLKSQNWQQRKSRARKAVKDMAEQLLKLHAKRKINSGHSYSDIGDEYFKFADSFPYEETEDQERVIAEVHSDLSALSPHGSSGLR